MQTKVIKISNGKSKNKDIALASLIIKNGGLVISPTDTVYGFLADAQNKKAVENIFKIKKRPKSKPLPIFVKNLKMAKQLAFIDDRQEKVLKRYWPGKYTFVLNSKPIFGSIREPSKSQNSKLYGVGKKTIALRITRHKFLNDLLKKVNKPLVQTSVNISSRKPLHKIGDIFATFGKNKLISLIIDAGDIKNAKPSKIIDLTTKESRILRV